jgi:threonine aldolase
MANQIAVRVHTRPGDVLLAGRWNHILQFESGATSALWGVQIQTLGRSGLFDARDLQAAIPGRDIHLAPASLVAIENTQNVSGGRVWPQDQIDEVTAEAREHGLAVHIDGARLFNAASASGTDPARIVRDADTVSFCLSKGLGAPVGSLLCCSNDQLEEVRRTRKLLGGGMRQAGILAAAGLYALDHHVERLHEDHRNARELAQGLGECGFELPALPESNIVVFDVPEGLFPLVADARAFSALAREHDLLIDVLDRRRLRAVTHLDAPSDRIVDALERVRAMLR